MRFDDYFNPKTGPEAVARLALYPLLILVIGGLLAGVVGHLRATELMAALCLLIAVSPAAYLIRERRQGNRRRERPRRGAERTPMLPPAEEDE